METARARHTPGPWIVQQGSAQSAFYIVGEAGRGLVVASMPCETVGALEDARLIAKAPQLLEAVRLAAALPLENFAGCAVGDAIREARRALQGLGA